MTLPPMKNKIMQQKDLGTTNLINSSCGRWDKNYGYRLIFILFFIVHLFSCSSASNNNTNQDLISETSNNNSNQESIDASLSIKEALSIQLKGGRGAKYGGSLGLYALFVVEEDILAQNGYKKPTVAEMKEKIKNVFGFYPPDVNDSISYIRIGNKMPTEDNGDPMDIINDEVLYYTNSVFSAIYVSYKQHLITYAYYLPEIFDYKKQYPELLKLEQNPVYYEDEFGEVIKGEHWKDVSDLEQQQKNNHDFIIHLNKYIFNDSKTSLTWLINNHKEFLRMLVKYYGYNKEPRINQLVLEDI